MKRFRLACLIPLLCLSSCSKSNPYGLYEFRLGKTDGSHLSVSAELNEKTPEGREGFHEISLSIDLGDEFSIKKVIEEYSDKYPIIGMLVEALGIEQMIEEQKIPTVSGYFNLSEFENEKYGTRLNVGSDALSNFIKKIAEKEGIPLPDPEFDLKPEEIEKFMCVYLSKKSLTLQIPVSLADFVEQLTWYGTFVDVDLDKLDLNDLEATIENLIMGLIVKSPINLNPDLLPGPKGRERYGVHPVVDNKKQINEVAQMNEIFKFEFSHTLLYKDDKPVGSFVAKTVLGEDEDKTYKELYFKQLDSYTDTLSSPIIGKVYSKDGSEFSEEHTIKFTVDENNRILDITHNGESGKDEKYTVITDEDKHIEISNFVQNPFVFRDFHDVKVGLSRI